MKFKNYKVGIFLRSIITLIVFLSLVGCLLFFSIKAVIMSGFRENGNLLFMGIGRTNYIIAKIKNIIITQTIFLILVAIFFIYKLSCDRFRALYIDYLTEINNKRFYDMKLEKYIKEVQITRSSLCIMMIDIDSFKEVNDTYGHGAGDMVLQHVAKTIKENTRENDSCCRLGGDEFVVILPDTDIEQAKMIGERIVNKLKYNPPYINENYHKYDHITVSVGIAEWNNHFSADKFSKCADDALYISKSIGKDKITVYV